MAYPTGYSRYQEVTIDKDEVDANLTDFPVYIDLSDLVKAGDDLFDTCRSDGGDIRITKSDGTTQLAREVVAIDTSAKTGQLHFKYTGTLSSTADTIVRIYYNGTDTEPATDSTYGRDNVWSRYISVHHLNSNVITDSTGNGHTGTANNMDSGNIVTGKFGTALDYNGSNEYVSIPDSAPYDSASGNLMISFWGKVDTTPHNDGFVWKKGSGNTSATGWGDYMQNDTGGYFRCDGGGADIYVPESHTIGDWFLKHYVVDRSGTNKTFLNGVADGTPVDATSLGSMATGNDVWFGRATSGSEYTDGQQQEVRIGTNIVSTEWMLAEESNQSAPSTFYATSDEKGGGTTFVPTVMMF